MTSEPFVILPGERREAVQAAVRGAFDAAAPTPLLPVSGGFSGALTYKFAVAGRPYLLRVETAKDFFRDTRRGFACMAAAAEAGVAPPLRFVDADTGVAIMDFLQSRPLGEHPEGAVGLAEALGRLVRTLQATAPFPTLADYRLILNGMTRQVAGSGLFAKGLMDPHLEGLAVIEAAYPWDAEAEVSSHNDPNPRNLIFDGERLWLVDWELAFRNDPLVDLAILANAFAEPPELETALLTAWRGRAPNAMLRSRLTLMRQLTRLFYGGLILSRFAAQPRGAPDEDLSAPTPDEFRAAVAEGRLSPATPQTAYIYGKMYLAGFLAVLRTPAFQDALATVRAG
jgi:aminoglycoside phosphotransferase (APT) family kinase protein